MSQLTPLDPQTLKSFDVAVDLVKQLITLSTGSIALTLTFLKDMAQTVPPRTGWLLRMSWLLHGAVVVFGLLALAGLAGSLGTTAAAEGIYRTNIALWAGLQFVAFGFATSLIVVFGYKAFVVKPPTPAEANSAVAAQIELVRHLLAAGKTDEARVLPAPPPAPAATSVVQGVDASSGESAGSA